MARITIEDCLETGYNKFALVHMATKRIIQLRKGKSLLVPTHNKEIVASLREIAAEKVITREPGTLPADDLLPLELGEDSLTADHSMLDDQAGDHSLESAIGEELEIIDQEEDAAGDQEDDSEDGGDDAAGDDSEDLLDTK
jgi:DNA-directed RNA polymerase subunit omega